MISLTKEAIQTIFTTPRNYFQIAEEYVKLQGKFMTDTVYETIYLWADMLIIPCLTILYMIWKAERPSMFKIISFQKTVELWKDWCRYSYLKTVMRSWMSAVRSSGGPFITTNDPTYHVFVYADGMERLLILTKERAKRTKQFSTLFNSGLHFS